MWLSYSWVLVLPMYLCSVVVIHNSVHMVAVLHAFELLVVFIYLEAGVQEEIDKTYVWVQGVWRKFCLLRLSCDDNVTLKTPNQIFFSVKVGENLNHPYDPLMLICIKTTSMRLFFTPASRLKDYWTPTYSREFKLQCICPFVFTSTASTRVLSALIGKESTDSHEQWTRVWATNRVGLFSILVVDAAHWCVLIRLRECPVLWIIVFPSLPQSVVRASSSTWCYDWAIRLPSFPVSNSSECNNIEGGRKKRGSFFLCICACMCAYMAGWRDDMRVRQHNMSFLHKEMQ